MSVGRGGAAGVRYRGGEGRGRTDSRAESFLVGLDLAKGKGGTIEQSKKLSSLRPVLRVRCAVFFNLHLVLKTPSLKGQTNPSFMLSIHSVA